MQQQMVLVRALSRACAAQYIAGSNGLYDVLNTCGHAACNQYLSGGQDCGNTLVDMYTQDDGSGRQQWQVS